MPTSSSNPISTTGYFIYNSPIGDLTVTVEENFLTGIWFPGKAPGNLPERWDSPTGSTAIDTCRWLDEYFMGHDPGFIPPMRLKGTVFRQRVWAELLNIPFGTTTTYKAIADALGGTSPRAVGGAVGHNRISILIPCHRVIGSDGSMTGYAENLDRKSFLLNHESR